jgi:hypothetical protein
MLNPLETYRDAGAKAAKARRWHDETSAQFHSNWASRATRLEKPADQPAARQAFDAGYRNESTRT